MATSAVDGATDVGIDVAGACLEVWLEPSGEHWTAANDACGVAALVARLSGAEVALVVLEATGGYEHAAAAALGVAGWRRPTAWTRGCWPGSGWPSAPSRGRSPRPTCGSSTPP